MTIGPDLSPDARRALERMRASDNVADELGIEIDVRAAGEATARMRITDAMTNGHAIAHGGLIFTLADTAFAYACNGYEAATVARSCSIEFLSPARAGDQLTADAREVVRRGRGGVYDATVRDASGAIIAEFRGRSHTLRYSCGSVDRGQG
jgi:acyl-CoA thioesterase